MNDIPDAPWIKSPYTYEQKSYYKDEDDMADEIWNKQKENKSIKNNSRILTKQNKDSKL